MLAGLVLAGGESRRMGTPKALLRWEGETLLARARRLLIGVGAERVIVAGPAEWGGIPDARPGLGPLGGILTGIGQLRPGEKLLVVPVDMPGLTAEALGLLVDRSHAAFSDSELPAIFTQGAELAAALDGALSGRRSVRELLEATGADRVGLPARLSQVLRNANTPAEWLDFTRKTSLD
jgi:molybdopterin-guanine dinucleotide biosynthesis protein A